MAYTPNSSGGTPAPPYKRKNKKNASVGAAIGQAYDRYGNRFRDSGMGASARSGSAGSGGTIGKPAKPKPPKRKPLLTPANALGVRTNTVATGAGSQRQGRKYQVKVDQHGNYYHVYGRGIDAGRVRLDKATARTYGYIS